MKGNERFKYKYIVSVVCERRELNEQGEEIGKIEPDPNTPKQVLTTANDTQELIAIMDHLTHIYP